MNIRSIILWGLAAVSAQPAASQTVLKVTRVPATTAPTDTLFLAGSFNAWNPRNPAYALARNPDGSYQISLPSQLGVIEYKITRGSWERAETTGNHTVDLRQAPLVSTEVLAWSVPTAPVPRKSTATAQVHVLSEAFEMPQLGRKRRVLVYLPADYAQRPGRRYPVLYLHDGQNVFDEATSYSGEWGVDETLDHLRAAGQDATGSIVVAIDNASQYRADEYIPWRNDTIKAGGQGGAYVDFLALTLKPYVDAHYRTRPEAAHTGVAGSSLGGLISVYAALKYPRVFGQVGAFSPAFWVCNDSLRAFAKTHPAAPTARFYFVCGPKESKTMLPLMAQWHDALRAGGVPAANIAFHAPLDGEHKEWFWRREFAGAYQFLFNPVAKPKASSSKR